MKRHKLFAGLCSCPLLLAGCGGPAGRVKVSLNPKQPVREVPLLDMFDADSPPETPFRELAQLSMDGVPGDYLEALREFQIKGDSFTLMA